MRGGLALEPLRLRILGLPVRIEASSEEHRRRLRLCYGAMPRRDDEDDGATELRAALLATASGAFEIAIDGREPAFQNEDGAAQRRFHHELLHALMLRASGLFYVHAGVVEAGGRAIVLPGLSRAGKSTLVLALVREGARYLSDELLVFDPARRRALPFPRAIKIRDVCVAYFEDLRERFDGEGEGRFLETSALEGRFGEAAPIGAIVTPQWDSAGDDLPKEHDRGAAFLELTSSALNFGTHRAESLGHLAAIFAEASTHWLRWRDPRRAARALLDAVARGS